MIGRCIEDSKRSGLKASADEDKVMGLGGIIGI